MTPDRLKEVLDAVRTMPDLIPHDGITYCNIALDRVLGLCGIPRMTNRVTGQPHLANDMIDTMRANTSQWTPVSGDVACARAGQGILVVACLQAEGHGHLAPVLPLPMAFSPSWGKQVPFLSNVGRRNGVLRASQCFRTEPEYYSVKIGGQDVAKDNTRIGREMERGI